MAETPDLVQVIADVRGEAAVLRANRASFSPERELEIMDAVAAASEEWNTWLSEGDAAIRAGRSEDWMRARFEQFRRDGHGRMHGRARQYRACAVPRRANTTVAAARGRDAARGLRRAS
jgi:hypothetical protein